MNYIVLDLEWNQPSSPRAMVKNPVCLKGEIIQIGAVKMDENLEIIDTFKIMVKPKYYRSMHKKVSRLTSITDDDLEYGFPFKQALSYFNNWCTQDCIFLTWGGDDVRTLNSNLMVHKMQYYSIPKTYDIQRLFSRQITRDRRQYGLTQALELVNEPACIAHDALNDAINTARILRHLHPDDSQAYNGPCISEQTLTENGIQEFCEVPFEKRSVGVHTMEQRAWHCPECGSEITFKKWIKQNYEKNIAISRCSCGCEYFARVRVRKGDNRYRCNRIVYPLTEGLRSFYNRYDNIRIGKAAQHAKYVAERSLSSACL